MPSEKEGKILFHSVYVKPILAGVKVQSRRAGKRFFESGQVLTAIETETEKHFTDVKITKVFTQTFENMTDEEGVKDGFTDKTDFWNSFVKIYPSVTPKTVFTVVEFEQINKN